MAEKPTTENIKTGLIIFNPDKGFSYLNSAACKILAWDLSTLQKNYQELENLDPCLSQLAKILKHLDLSIGKVIELLIGANNYVLVISNLDKSDYLLEISPLVNHDIRQSTHELKRPIQNIKTLTETLIMGAKNETDLLDNFLERINAEADRLGGMVNDMLSLSRLLNGSIEMNIIELDLTKIIETIFERNKTRADQEAISLKLLTQAAGKFNGDKKLSEHLLANLIDNAIKYNQNGGSVEVHISDTHISIKDSGKGMPQEDLNKIFDQFYRSKEHANIQGTGLGLSICKAICDQHNWQLEVKSELGVGSEFVIRTSN